jgi:hypothetical protein
MIGLRPSIPSTNGSPDGTSMLAAPLATTR